MYNTFYGEIKLSAQYKNVDRAEKKISENKIDT